MQGSLDPPPQANIQPSSQKVSSETEWPLAEAFGTYDSGEALVSSWLGKASKARHKVK
jgi:hypothetical protein